MTDFSALIFNNKQNSQKSIMKFFLFGDEERFLLDKLRELNKNFDKETRIKFLRAEVKKRENIIHKRNKKHRWKCHKKLKIKISFIGRHKRRKKLVSEIKIDSMKEKNKMDDTQYSDFMDDIDEEDEPSENEVSEEENLKSEQLDTNFLQLISNELSNDQTESSDDDGDKKDNDDKSDKKEPEVTIVKDDTLEIPDKKSVEEKQPQKGSVVGGLV